MGHDCNNPSCSHHHTETVSSTILVHADENAPSPKAGDRATVHYSGRLQNADGTEGKEFDSSRKRGTPFDFVVGKGYVIKGWDIAVAQMKVGETRKVIIPASLGYGMRGVPGVIPQNATLIFDIELLDIASSSQARK